MREGESRNSKGADFYDGAGTIIGYMDATQERSLSHVYWDDSTFSFALENQLLDAEQPAAGTYDAVLLMWHGVDPERFKGRPLVDGKPDDQIEYRWLDNDGGEHVSTYVYYQPGQQTGVHEYWFDFAAAADET
jgi:hypothetical protein